MHSRHRGTPRRSRKRRVRHRDSHPRHADMHDAAPSARRLRVWCHGPWPPNRSHSPCPYGRQLLHLSEGLLKIRPSVARHMRAIAVEEPAREVENTSQGRIVVLRWFWPRTRGVGAVLAHETLDEPEPLGDPSFDGLPARNLPTDREHGSLKALNDPRLRAPARCAIRSSTAIEPRPHAMGLYAASSPPHALARAEGARRSLGLPKHRDQLKWSTPGPRSPFVRKPRNG